MEHVSFDELENRPRNASVTRRATEALSLEHMALNYYELAPGDTFSAGMHAHMEQEEVFLILEGTATFQTDSEKVSVGPMEGVRFEPGEYQQGRNEGGERVRALAMGAPREQLPIHSPVTCRECGAEYHQVEPLSDGFRLECPECANAFEV